VSCLAARSSTEGTTQFFTGGYDRTILFWSVTSSASTTSHEVTRLTTIPEALAFRGRGSLLVATSKKVLDIRLEHLSAIPSRVQMSNAVHQIHIHRQAPNVAILEVGAFVSLPSASLRLTIKNRLTI